MTNAFVSDQHDHGSVPVNNRRGERRCSPIIVALLILIAGAFPAVLEAKDPPPAAGTDTLPSPAKLFESMSGYLEGMHGAQGKTGGKQETRPAADRRRGPVVPASGDAENEQRLAREKSLADVRIERGEWSLAVPPLERAVQLAAGVKGGEESGRLKEKLEAARLTSASEPAGQALSGREMLNSVGMRLVFIQPGTFTMGSGEAEIRRIQTEWNAAESMIQPEGPAHKVRISRPYLLGKYEVTVGQFKSFVQETGYRTTAEKQGWGWVYDDSVKHWAKKSGASWRNPGGEVHDDHPVTLICHADAEAFCEWLTKKERRRYHLPTEAQWEFAARAGKEDQRYTWGNEYPDGRKLNMADRHSPVPWADRTVDDAYARRAPVGAYQPNAFRLYDMLGNVWELCHDFYDAKAYDEGKSATLTDPAGPKSGKKRAVRGGSWAFGAGTARNAFRFGIEADACTDMSGFRVAAAANADEAIGGRDTTEAARKPQGSTEEVERTLEDVKRLVESGRRLEARRIVEKLPVDTPSAGDKDRGAGAFVKSLLEALIDVTGDKSLQTFTNSMGMKMVRIPAGAFIMGSSEADISWAMGTLAQGQPISLENEHPFHKVRISRPFLISATEVTVAQFQTFVEETGYVTDAEDEKGGQVFNTETNRFERKAGSSWRNPGWSIKPDQPVAMVSWNDAQAFVEWLSAKEKLPYKLPTEAQWEYSCRGGLAAAPFPWGDDLPDGRRANYADKNTDFQWRDRTADDGYKFVAPVGSYEPNGYGLYDMAGNVLEWVRDYYSEDYYRYSPEVDPEGPGHGENRVSKGGEWTFGPTNLRCAFRGWSRPDLAFYNTGFRVSIELGSPQRNFHFAEDFLTREWVPGSDQRAVTAAVAKEREREAKSPAREAMPSRTLLPPPDPEPTEGVEIVDFTARSDARRVGMRKGDVIIRYNGEGNLNADRLATLAAASRIENVSPVVVYVREGTEYSVRLPPGLLGISVVDTIVRGPFKKPEPVPERTPPADGDKTKPKDWT